MKGKLVSGGDVETNPELMIKAQEDQLEKMLRILLKLEVLGGFKRNS